MLDLCGCDPDGFGHQVGTRLRSFAHAYAREPLTWPDTTPSAITVLTCPTSTAPVTSGCSSSVRLGADDGAHSVEVAQAAAGATVSYDAAHHWGRVPFRGGAVPMDARHIKVAEPGAYS
ncbi:hypothetical protein [Streptomyces sp. Rer75]|uniref:hypothetical protein n=1 Tax=unclassified Streptomyces TaxID=2593676 RepID=UPI0015D02CB6|nr:hypothetical protein [Streptomyces sp. Rer75]QLH19875.1 hypothetical protein HYQ63_03755 [Streptomyces sp. Rer75]